MLRDSHAAYLRLSMLPSFLIRNRAQNPEQLPVPISLPLCLFVLITALIVERTLVILLRNGKYGRHSWRIVEYFAVPMRE